MQRCTASMSEQSSSVVVCIVGTCRQADAFRIVLGGMEICSENDKRKRDGTVPRCRQRALDRLHMHLQRMLQRRDTRDNDGSQRGPQRHGHEAIEDGEPFGYPVVCATEERVEAIRRWRDELAATEGRYGFVIVFIVIEVLVACFIPPLE
eukprot:GHVU01156433.1.p3 GENE.GHVU01156433.1~~GHVU01156433.1.p3  ORF type:complete len:150 (+),score=20.78 GHVU01156433.1:417-866(+)